MSLDGLDVLLRVRGEITGYVIRTGTIVSQRGVVVIRVPEVWVGF
jgi:hypothetical protein